MIAAQSEQRSWVLERGFVGIDKSFAESFVAIFGTNAVLFGKVFDSDYGNGHSFKWSDWFYWLNWFCCWLN